MLALRQLASADDRNYRHGSIAKPRERHLGHAAAGVIGHTLDGGDHAAGALWLRHEAFRHIVIHAARLAWRSGGAAVPVVLARQHSSGQWRPRRHSYIQRLSHWDQLALDRSLDQAVFNLP